VYIDMETPNVGHESQSLPIHLLSEPKAYNHLTSVHVIALYGV